MFELLDFYHINTVTLSYNLEQKVAVCTIKAADIRTSNYVNSKDEAWRVIK